MLSQKPYISVGSDNGPLLSYLNAYKLSKPNVAQFANADIDREELILLDVGVELVACHILTYLILCNKQRAGTDHLSLMYVIVTTGRWYHAAMSYMYQGDIEPCLTFASTMTSWNGNIFRVTDPLCGEFIDHRWIPLRKASDAELWCFVDLSLNKRLSKQSWSWWFETPLRSSLRHRNVSWILQWRPVIAAECYW